MDDASDNKFYKSFFAVLAGVLSAIGAGFIIKIIVEKMLHHDPFSALTINQNESSFSILMATGAWLFVSSFIGGLICAMITGRNDLSHIIISSLVALALYFVIGGTEFFKTRSPASWIILLMIPAGYFIGEWIGAKKRNHSI